MEDCSIWTDDNTVLLNAEEIKRINAENPSCFEYEDENGNLNVVKTSELDKTINKADVIGLIKAGVLSIPGKIHNCFGEPVGDDFIEKAGNNQNISSIPDKVKIKYAVCIKRTLAFYYPCRETFYSMYGDEYYNKNVSSELLPGEGVVVLNMSADGEWLFVLADFFVGWIEKETVAYCAGRKEWEKALNPDKFIVVTGYKSVIDTVNTARGRFDEIACMGMKFALSDETKGTVNGRSTYGSYVVRMPSVNNEGMLCFVDATIAVSQDVNVGYLELTPSNIVKQAYKFLGHSYGWGGMDGATDCSGMIRMIYRCFGIKLPRNSNDMEKVNGFKTLDFSEGTSEAERCLMLKDVPAGSIMILNGYHAVIYLGIKDGSVYGISACGVCADTKAKTSKDIVFTDMNCVFVGKMNDFITLNRRSWLENTEKIIIPLNCRKN